MFYAYKNTTIMEFKLENKEYIVLNSLLKLLSLAESGGQANMFISEGEVLVNNITETRKRKKIFAGDVVEFDGEKITIT